MSNILVVLGSARTGRVAEKVASYVLKDIETREGVTATVADLKELNLPFFDNEISPASSDYGPINPQVIAWSAMVKSADSVLFVTPEYNHSLSAIEKNAIDSLYVEWNNKPVISVNYGWDGGTLSAEAFRGIMTHIKADLKHDIAHLVFMKDITPDGSILDEAHVASEISTAIDEVV